MGVWLNRMFASVWELSYSFDLGRFGLDICVSSVLYMCLLFHVRAYA